MLKCTRCKFPISDMSDGCSQCKDFKKKKTFRDAEGDNSIPEDIDNMRRVARNIINHLEHVYKVRYKGNHNEYDPELIKSLALASKTMGDIIKHLRSIQSGARRQLASMSSEERSMLLAKALADLSDIDRLRILELARDEETKNKPILNPFSGSVDTKRREYD